MHLLQVRPPQNEIASYAYAILYAPTMAQNIIIKPPLQMMADI